MIFFLWLYFKIRKNNVMIYQYNSIKKKKVYKEWKIEGKLANLKIIPSRCFVLRKIKNNLY